MCRKVSSLRTGQPVMFLPQRKTVALSTCHSETRDKLSAHQADAIAQGQLMSVMRTRLDIWSMPWESGRLVKISPFLGEQGALRFSDDTIHGKGASFRFFGVCWTYEGEGRPRLSGKCALHPDYA